MAMKHLVLGLACSAVPLLSAAEATELHWDAQGRFEHRAAVAPGQFVELCGRLEAGVKVRWQFEASEPLDFNIHYHEGKDVHYPAREPQRTASQGTLEAAAPQDYCWMWTNRRKASVPLRVLLQKQ